MSTMASHLSISTSTPSQTPAPTPAVAVAASEWIVYIEHYPRDSYKRDNTSKIKNDKEERECSGWGGVIVATLHKAFREGLIRR